jgi:hypothetical protein
LAIFVGKIGKNNENSKKNVNNKKLVKKFGSNFFSKKMLLIISKNFKLILIIPTLNT